MDYDAAIDYLEQTKKSDLDPSNIMDAEGIRKITELTAAQNIRTNEFAQNERLEITKKDMPNIFVEAVTIHGCSSSRVTDPPMPVWR